MGNSSFVTLRKWLHALGKPSKLGLRSGAPTTRLHVSGLLLTTSSSGHITRLDTPIEEADYVMSVPAASTQLERVPRSALVRFGSAFLVL